MQCIWQHRQVPVGERHPGERTRLLALGLMVYASMSGGWRLALWMVSRQRCRLGSCHFSIPQRGLQAPTEVQEQKRTVPADRLGAPFLGTGSSVWCRLLHGRSSAFFFFGRSSLVRNGSGMFVQSYFLFDISLNPFINLLVMV